MFEGHDAFRFEAVGFLLEFVYGLAVKVEAAVHLGLVLCLFVGAKLYVSPWKASGQASLRVWKPRKNAGLVYVRHRAYLMPSGLPSPCPRSGLWCPI